MSNIYFASPISYNKGGKVIGSKFIWEHFEMVLLFLDPSDWTSKTGRRLSMTGKNVNKLVIYLTIGHPILPQGSLFI